jgi:hypothetical protein
MGWDSCSSWNSKKDVVNSLNNSLKRNGYGILAEKSTTDGVWYVVQKENCKFIYFGLIKKSRGEFALKTLTEDCHPFYYSCPVKFFDLAPRENNEWRAKVIAMNQKKSIKLTEGMKFRLYGDNFEVASIHSLGKGKNYIVKNESGQRFRLKRTQLKDIESIGE